MGPSAGLSAPGRQGVRLARGASTCSSDEPWPGSTPPGACGENCGGGGLSGPGVASGTPAAQSAAAPGLSDPDLGLERPRASCQEPQQTMT